MTNTALWRCVWLISSVIPCIEKLIVYFCSWLAENAAEKRPVLSLTDEETRPEVSVFAIFKKVWILLTSLFSVLSFSVLENWKPQFIITLVSWLRSGWWLFLYALFLPSPLVLSLLSLLMSSPLLKGVNGVVSMFACVMFHCIDVLYRNATAVLSLFTGKYFIPVSCFLLFNLMDWAGRSLTAVCMWVRMCVC